jgi:hypothetical protein
MIEIISVVGLAVDDDCAHPVMVGDDGMIRG